MVFAKQYVELPSGMLAYVQAGEGGTPIVFLHGIPTSSFLWRKVIAILQLERSCYALDLLGYGDSDKPPDGDLSLPAQVVCLSEWLDSVATGPIILVGHDIGGGIAQLFVTRYPERIERLILVDTIAYDSFPEPGIARLKEPTWDERLRTRDLRPGFRRAFEQGLVHHDGLTDELVEAYVAPWMGLVGRQSYLRAARALRTEDLAEQMGAVEAISCPVLVLWGERDVFQDISYGQRLVDALPDARLEVCSDGGHFLPEDRPEWVAEQISSFVSAGRSG